MSWFDSNKQPADFNKPRFIAVYIVYTIHFFGALRLQLLFHLSYITCENLLWEVPFLGNTSTPSTESMTSLSIARKTLFVNLITITYPFSKGNSNML